MRFFFWSSLLFINPWNGQSHFKCQQYRVIKVFFIFVQAIFQKINTLIFKWTYLNALLIIKIYRFYHLHFFTSFKLFTQLELKSDPNTSKCDVWYVSDLTREFQVHYLLQKIWQSFVICRFRFREFFYFWWRKIGQKTKNALENNHNPQ